MSTGSVSPWATAPVAARAFADIMSEELESNNFNCQAGIASQGEEQDYIYNEEDFMTPDELCAKRLAEKSALLNTPSINNDFVHNEDDFLTDEEKADRDFAMALAAQDEENILPENKDQKRGNSKVNVCASLLEHFTYGNSDHAGQRAQVSSSNFEAEELGAKLMGHAGSSGVAFRNGVANVDGTRVSKHDSLIDGLMNSMSLGELDGSGDMTGLMVSNTVSNSIKNFNSKQTKKGVYVGGGGRVSAKDSRSTSEAVLDETTRLLLFKMSQKGVFDEVHGVIKTGKESNVYHATRHRDAPLNVHKSSDLDQENCVVVSDRDATVQFKDSGEDEGEKEDTRSVASSARSHLIFENSDFDYHDVAVKVFKTTLNEFGNRIDYIKGDHRFSREKYAKNSNNKRKFIAQVQRAAEVHYLSPCFAPPSVNQCIVIWYTVGRKRVPKPLSGSGEGCEGAEAPVVQGKCVGECMSTSFRVACGVMTYSLGLSK